MTLISLDASLGLLSLVQSVKPDENSTTQINILYTLQEKIEQAIQGKMPPFRIELKVLDVLNQTEQTLLEQLQNKPDCLLWKTEGLTEKDIQFKIGFISEKDIELSLGSLKDSGKIRVLDINQIKYVDLQSISEKNISCLIETSRTIRGQEDEQCFTTIPFDGTSILVSTKTSLKTWYFIAKWLNSKSERRCYVYASQTCYLI